MFYAFIRAVVGFALRLFYRVHVQAPAEEPTGPVMYVANHPNAIIDAALVFVVTRRHVTFLAREPLFRRQPMGWILRGMGALPVYRRQDNANATQMAANEGTLESASKALISGGAITIFPEGVSHSEPHLAELKTGAARIAFRAARAGAALQIVPVGLTYSDKHRFRSQVRIEVGQAIAVTPFLPPPSSPPEVEQEAVRGLTAAVSEGLRSVTLDLEKWEDLPVIETAEQLYSLSLGNAPRDPARLRRFGKGIQLFRAEQPERYQKLRDELMAFRARLLLVRASPKHLHLEYQRAQVWGFVLRNLAVMLVALPLLAVGFVLFAVPFLIPRWAARLSGVDLYRQATLKFLLALALTPFVYAAIFWVAYRWFGTTGAVVACLLGLPLALFTRYFVERWRKVARDAQVFFTLGSRSRLKQLLLVDGEKIASEIEAVAMEIGPRVGMPAPAEAVSR